MFNRIVKLTRRWHRRLPVLLLALNFASTVSVAISHFGETSVKEIIFLLVDLWKMWLQIETILLKFNARIKADHILCICNYYTKALTGDFLSSFRKLKQMTLSTANVTAYATSGRISMCTTKDRYILIATRAKHAKLVWVDDIRKIIRVPSRVPTLCDNDRPLSVRISILLPVHIFL